MNYAVGVDLGGTFVKLGLIDTRGKIVSRRGFSTGQYSTKNELIGGIVHGVKGVLARAGKRGDRVLGVGIGVPGLVDSEKGVAYRLVNIPGWENVPLKQIIEKGISLNVFVDNDVNLMALGEYTYGAGKGTRNLICLTLGTGVGGGIIIDGELYRGSSLAAGEIGHIPISEKGPRCNCGGIGCLEAYVGNRYLERMAVRELKRGRHSLINRIIKGDMKKVSPLVLSEAARCGDALAKEIWELTGRRIGVALAGLINVLDPDMVVIGGGVARAGKVLFDPIRASVRLRTKSFRGTRMKIVRARLGNIAGIVGAAALVRGKIKK